MFNIFKSKTVSPDGDPSIEEREKTLKTERGQLQHDKKMFVLRQEFDTKVRGLQEAYNAENHKLAVQAANDTKDREHEFHSKTGEQDTKLAVLNKEVQVKEELMENFNKIEDVKATAMKEKYEAIIKEKDESITRLDGIVKVLTTKLPDVDLKNMNITVNPNKE